MKTPLHVGFWEKVKKSDGCWEWTGYRTRFGHGQISRYRRGGGQDVFYVHRVSYEMARGPVPDGLCVCHHCDNPPCVNPDHLFLGTHKDNMADRDAKGRVQHKLSREQVKEIIDAHRAGTSAASLASRFSVTTTTIYRRIRRARIDPVPFRSAR